MTNISLKLAETISSNGIKSVYGEPVTIDGTTMVPVAAVQYGFGAGSVGAGSVSAGAVGDGEFEAPGGAGGGGVSIPLGAYISDERGMHFRPNIITLLVVGIPFVWVAGHAWARVIRTLKK
jgi:uncharacterized spore protein YtfJ